ncbi:MAG: hypothetical protein RLN89_06065 [Parvibaculum sp.]
MTRQHEPVMTYEEATDILERFGGDETAWPETERMALKAAIEVDANVRQAWEEAIALDSVLMKSGAPVPSSTLMSKILADAKHVQAANIGRVALTADRRPLWRQILELLWPYGSALVPAGALAASIALGVGVGMQTVDTQSVVVDNSAYDIVAYAVGDVTLVEEWQ